MSKHYIDDPAFIVGLKPDFSGLGLKPVEKLANNKSSRKLSREFERRLYKLNVSIVDYFVTGNFGSLFPRLFSCISYVWSHHNDGRVYSKTSVKK